MAGRPRKHPPGTTAAEIARLAEARLIEAGWRKLNLRLSPDAIAALAAVRTADETATATITRVLIAAALDTPRPAPGEDGA